MNTPRTDAMLEANGLRCSCSEKPIELCHQLEAELAALTAERDALRSTLEAVQATHYALSRARATAEAERDAALGRVKVLRHALDAITRVDGADDAGGTTWQCAQIAHVALMP